MKKTLIFFTILFTFATAPILIAIGQTQSAPPLQTLTMTADTFTARFVLPELKIQTRTSSTDGNSEDGLTEIHFAGADWTLDVGKPRLPIYTQRIGIPTTGTPVVTVIQARSKIKTIENVRITPDDPIFPTLNPTDPPQISQGFYPTQLVEVTPSGFVRNQRIGNLQINPVQYNPATKQLKIFAVVTFRVHFPTSPVTGAIGNAASIPTAPTSFRESSRVFENLFRSTLWNYEQAKPWRKQRRTSHRTTNEAYAPGAPPLITTANTRRFRIPVTSTDMYKITYNNIRAYANIEPETIDLDTVRLESGGKKKGVHIFDENGNNTLDPGDQLIFYGRALADNKFTDQNVYWLRFGLRGEPAAGFEASRVEVRDAAPQTQNSPTPTAFLTRTRFEENRFHDVLEANDIKSELADHYFGVAFRGGDLSTSRKDFPIYPFELPMAIPRGTIERPAILRIKFQGASYKTNAGHEARIIFNNHQLGRIEEWRRQAFQIATREIEAKLVHHDATNLMRIEALDRNKTPPGSYDFYLDWYEIDYWRTFQADKNRLEFNTHTEPVYRGQVQYRVGNIIDETIDVYQLNENGITSKLTGGVVSPAGVKHQIRFEDTVNNYRRYFVIGRTRYRSINALIPTPPTSLKNPGNQVDYIFITHPTFAESIIPLVEFRSSQGLKTLVVDINDIYDEFSDGLFNPFAIQKFLRYAYHNYQQPAPTYVLLVGDAHYDYKNATVEIYRRDTTFPGTYNLYPNFVPTYHGWAPASGETAMDQRFVNISGDDALPDMLIGRLSVQTPEALTTIIQKIIDYEENPKIGLWQGTLIQVADNEIDHPSDAEFERSRDELIQEVIPVGYDTRQIYLRKIKSPEVTRRKILSEINRGALVLEYAGHGGSQTWADESIFRIEDVAGLQNRYLPFVVTTTCLNGQFDKPQQFGNFCLSEQFLLGRYGAIATLSATRLTYGSANAAFDIDLFEALFRVPEVSPELATSDATLQPTIGHIVADAKISFITRIQNPSWIPGAEQYTLFGDPASRLARPQLDVKVELERTALNDTHKIVIKANEVGVLRDSGVGGAEGVSFTPASDFSTEKLTAFAAFANNFDDNIRNDLTRQAGGRVWQGEYGTIRIDIPNNAIPGGGFARVFAHDDTRAAVGGTRFSIDTPVVQDIRETLDTKVTDTLNISVLVVDDKGPDGIEDISVIWDDTATNYEDTITPMVPARIPLGDVPLGGQWYELETPIRLPKGGRQIRYRILITDSNGHEVAMPSKLERYIVRVPEGPNVAIGTDKTDRTPIQYIFDEDRNGYQLVAELINNGERPVLADIEIVFAEGNPDADGDLIVDEDADILGITTVKATDWVEGTYVWQRATATLNLNTPLETGIHRIYVLADPEDPSIDDKIDGNVEEARVFDNKHHTSLVVNDFNYRSQEPLTAFSLDRVFDIHFPANALETETQNAAGIPLAVTSQLPAEPIQPDLQFAPIPRVAALRRGLIRQGEAVAQYYQPAFRTGATALAKPATLKFRFDVSALEDIVQKETEIPRDNPVFEYELTQLTNQLAIYAWQTDIASGSTHAQTAVAEEPEVKLSAWRRLPSQINYTPEGDFHLENYVTPTQVENGSQQELETDAISINPNLTPAAIWVITFLDDDEYEVFFKRNGDSTIQKIDRIGQLDNPFREDVFGLELWIPRQENPTPDVNHTLEFGDVFAFETDYDTEGNIVLTEIWSTNRGNGKARVDSRLGPKAEFETGDWFIFFTDADHYELRDTSNEPSYFPNGIKVRGTVNVPIFLTHLGFEIFVDSGSEDFQFGDKIKFSTARVASITTEVTELTQFALIRSTDTEPPTFNLWVDGLQPQTGSVIPPRPEISIVLQDINGIDTEFFTFQKQKDDGPFEPVTDYELRIQGGIGIVPIDYRPILFPGEYTFNIKAQDFNGNAIGGDDGVVSYRFFVVEAPDITPPTIDIQVTTHDTSATNGAFDEPLTDGTVLTEQPHFTINLTDDSALDETTFRFNFGNLYETPTLLDTSRYNETFDPAAPANAAITYAPDLPNGEYQLHITAADTSENVAELTVSFTLNEKVTLSEVFNVPNPMVDRKTFFTYHLAQAPDSVTIKIYSVNGRLLRTLVDASANRGTNETGWDGRDEIGIRCANGVYFYRVIAHTDEKKIEQVGKLAILR